MGNNVPATMFSGLPRALQCWESFQILKQQNKKCFNGCTVLCNTVFSHYMCLLVDVGLLEEI